MMGFFDKLGNSAAPPAPAQGKQMTPEAMRAEIGSIRQNPAAYLGQRGMKIPDGMTDPREITTYLLRSGQIAGGRVGQLFRMLGIGPGK